MKLWQKGYELDPIIERYLTGDDPQLDLALIRYDCIGSIAHARMLQKIGILSAEEYAQLKTGLQEIIRLAEENAFSIPFQQEDVHTAVENWLTEKFGDLGKKLHTARSRNDQVLLDLRLYMREELNCIAEAIQKLCSAFLTFAAKYQTCPMPGRTHFQPAMPSSVGLWAGAFAEALLDDLDLLSAAYTLIDQCPLGSAASYGVPLAIDRQLVSDLLGFERVQNNVLYANNSRGKFEAVVLEGCHSIMQDLSKWATDVILFSIPEFGYFDLPEILCAGSSLMPQKRNPCPLELMRAKASTLMGCLVQTLAITNALPSGYNRDFQETKRPLMQGLNITKSSLHVAQAVLEQLSVNQEACIQAFTPDLFATDAVLKQVEKGIAFRDAYAAVAVNPSQYQEDPRQTIQTRMHVGATGNLGLDKSWKRLEDSKNLVMRRRRCSDWAVLMDHLND